jgi:hypothetical protein
MGQTELLTGAENWAKLTSIGCVESQRRIGDKITTHAKRLKAGWDDQYLLKVLAQPARSATKV